MNPQEKLTVLVELEQGRKGREKREWWGCDEVQLLFREDSNPMKKQTKFEKRTSSTELEILKNEFSR